MDQKKIAIIGISGSGKSTLARQFAAKTGLPVFHMDAFLWNGNWRSVPMGEYIAKHKALIKKEKWIVEGYIDKEMSDRLKEADLVIYLDYSGVLCGWRMIRRWWKHRKESRPELPKEALDEFDLKAFIRAFTRGHRKNIQEALAAGKPKKVVTIHSPKELEVFMSQLK